ncbi:ATP-binding protein [Sphingomonas sp. LY29]|uniref:sensor histidine kinase n=1 Tax=Sphingomonas sp. LY29 TaxID=3095341 RepID=UPI002D78EFE3|nr:ATP-binding protein [Sphingomonas sp. LY29]WRP25734.1 ATP-binding protein [Sphingomonas sp. LY29]
MLVGLLGGFVLLIVAFFLIVAGLRSSTASSERVQHTYEVKDTLGALTIAVERTEAARRGYLLTPNDYRMQIYREWSPRILPALNKLEGQVSDSPTQTQRLERLRPIVIRYLTSLDRSMDVAGSGDLVEARREFDKVDSLRALQAIRARANDVGEQEERLLEERLAATGSQLSFLQILLVVTGIMLAGVAAFTFWLVRRFTRDLLASRARLNLLNTNLEGAVAERTADLQRANAEIQKFAYIVSHDLRSPLVNVMGFTAELERADKVVTDFVAQIEKTQPELVSDDVRYAAKEDLPEAIGFIRSSTQKMDRLINAILDLSRQGRRVLAAEQLPMDKVIGDIASSLEVLAGERNARFMIETPLPDIIHDRLAIEQIFTNLMENATKYLAPGRPGIITVRGKRQGSRVVYEVQDNGRGIAPEDHERVFELFRRSGQQDQKGEGIGLANVRALAYRLGGTVTLRSVLSEGSTFIVELPTEFKGEE